MKLRRLFVIVIVGEGLLGIVLATRWWTQSPLRLPATVSDDPAWAAEVADLAAATRFGGAAAWTALGDALLGRGDYRNAELAYRRVTEMAPQDIEARFALAFCLDRTGRMADANEHYRRCLELPDRPGPGQSKKPFALYAIGRNLLRLEDEAAAEAVFRQNPGFPPADYQLARILLFTGRPREALEVVDRGLASLPLALEWHRLRGRIMDALDRPADAFAARGMEERSAHLLEVNFSTGYVRPLTTRHGIKQMLDGYGAAAGRESPEQLSQRLDAIEAAIGGRMIPESITLMQFRANQAMMFGDPQEVVDMIAAQPWLRDSDPLMAIYEADALARLDRSDEATALRRRLVAIAPSASLHRKLAVACESSGDQAGRNQQLSQAELLDGIALYRRNDIAGALPRFVKAVELDPANAAAHFHRGEMLYHLGRRKEATSAFRDALTKRPGFGRASDFLEYIVDVDLISAESVDAESLDAKNAQPENAAPKKEEAVR
jgi:tetratricopeptide (TPR) repeat protein